MHVEEFSSMYGLEEGVSLRLCIIAYFARKDKGEFCVLEV